VYDPAMDGGFTTGAIRAATRVPRVQLTPAQLADARIAPGLLRISVGLEDVADLRADVENALDAARATSAAAFDAAAPTPATA
jgi:cystathionine beta-lyase/cystathionine gamma-synthase